MKNKYVHQAKGHGRGGRRALTDDQADVLASRFESLVGQGVRRRVAMELLASSFGVHWRTVANTLKRGGA